MRRLRARSKSEMIVRSYDAAQTFRTDDWSSATKGSANSETRGALGTMRSKARDAVRNNPHATKALNVIVSNTVGSGIMPNIKGKTKLQTRQIQQAWREWGETTSCDANKKHNFYGLQALVMATVPESGEVLALKEVDQNQNYPIRILEADYIADTADTIMSEKSQSVTQGIKVDSQGVVQGYLIYDNHPGDVIANISYKERSADQVCHVYRQQRPGQLRGVTWFHSVIRALGDLNEFEQATLISKKIQACFSVLVTSTDDNGTLSAADLKTKRERENMLEPGAIRYLDPGEGVQVVAPAATTDYDPYTRSALRKIASGLGITYEAMTSDYSQVNFSSGRMGHLEFRRNVEMWRWGMLIPQFCEPSFQHFLKWCREVRGIPTEGVTCQWVPPSWPMIDPEKEINAARSALRSGLMSYQNAVREQGYEPEILINEMIEANKMLDSGGLVLDSDPRKTTQAGMFQLDQTTNKPTA
jgi:lambda family phage portal protein